MSSSPIASSSWFRTFKYMYVSEDWGEAMAESRFRLVNMFCLIKPSRVTFAHVLWESCWLSDFLIIFTCYLSLSGLKAICVLIGSMQRCVCLCQRSRSMKYILCTCSCLLRAVWCRLMHGDAKLSHWYTFYLSDIFVLFMECCLKREYWISVMWSKRERSRGSGKLLSLLSEHINKNPVCPLPHICRHFTQGPSLPVCTEDLPFVVWG